MITALVGYGLTPWDTIRVAMGEVDGVDQQTLLAFAAGYTLPATLGFALIVWLVYTRALREMNGVGQFVTYAVILGATAMLCQFLGLGLIPDFGTAIFQGGPFYVTIPLFVGSAYVNTYGVPLIITAAAIGAATGLHVGVHTRQTEG